MHKWVCVLLLGVALAGCSGIEEESGDEGPDLESPASNDTAPLLGFVLSLNFTELNFTAGEPLQVQFGQAVNFTLTADANATVAWHAELAPEPANATLNATTNATTITAEGVGLPANVSIAPDGVGNYTLFVVASAQGYTNATLSTAVTVVEPAAEVILDPCAGVPPQDPISVSDIFVGVAVDGTGIYQDHPFNVGPCQTGIFVEITSSEAFIDPMLRLKDNTGATVDEEDNEFLYHDTLAYEPGGLLEPGTWQIDVRGYVGAPGTYDVVISFE